MEVAAALLAAGGGTRFDGATHKLLTELDGHPLWRWSLGHVLAAGFEHVVLVTGAVDLDPPDGVTVVRNPKWAAGQAGSLQAAVRYAADTGAEALIVGLADQPGVPAAAWRAVADAPPSPIVIATYDGVPGPNPVRLHHSMWPLLPAAGDQGARGLIGAHPEWVTSVACLGSAHDIDTLEDLERWRRC